MSGSNKRWRATPGSELAQLRMEAHLVLDVHWEFGGCTRSEAYIWLAGRLGISGTDCHIGMFDEEQCRRSIAVCREHSPAEDARLMGQ